MATKVQATQTPGPRTVSSSGPTGTWQHPRFDEIQRRLNATTFNDQNIKAIIRNIILWIFMIYMPSISSSIGLTYIFSDIITAFSPYNNYALNLIRMLPLAGIIQACSPLYRPKDDLADIALTPQQRTLLGLRPTAKPATPGSQYITPPRYAKSTPRSGSTSRSGSPYSVGGSSHGSATLGASYSPNASPLFHRAVGKDLNRRLSFGSPSPLTLSASLAPNESVASLVPSTPSPLNGRGASVTLNNKWLYEKGRRSSSGLKGSY